ncbi:MAG: hypothetical protein ACD_46C00586G0002 [uncultured bacterium]|nr:MAG: hypothetical protein ACD_46C00586G0002 [uncultured bacterium]HBE90837.1 hypothetical protein [Candidatus Andersenbacteria bacterium]
MLAENGIIDVTQHIIRPYIHNTNVIQYLKNSEHAHLVVELLSELNQRVVLYFDNHDAMEIDEKNLQACDIYFKRSFSRQYINEFHAKYAENIFPLGLNYHVLPNKSSIIDLHRNISLSRSISSKFDNFLSYIDRRNIIKFQPRLQNIQSLPLCALKPKVLFMVAAYDPYNTPERPKAKIEERRHNNEVRANCVRLLRKELGPNFYGGFVPNKYAIMKYKDVLLDNPINAKKQNYLQILSNFSICIATTGLHGSIGWKFAEYVAFSKAIVSEKIQYEIPGHFQSEHNYIEFSSPDTCVDQSIRLLTNEQLRTKLMFNNSIYYHHYVKPDSLVMNAILLALKKLRLPTG